MIKIYLANDSKQGLGGGWTFLNLFKKYGKREELEFVDDKSDCDLYFISGATMVQRPEVLLAKEMGKKIVLRVDNIPRNSRNRNTGTSRLYDYAQMADLVIYQSEWAKEFIMPFIKKDGAVIINGSDKEIFNMNGSTQPKEGDPQYGYVQFNRDETKQWHQAWYQYQQAQRKHENAHLFLIGKFSPENIQYNFDFFMGEKYTYVGVLDNPEDMAEYLRAIDVLLIPYYNDACSNTLIEARLCGVGDIRIDESGGSPEIMAMPLEQLGAGRMVREYIKEFTKIL